MRYMEQRMNDAEEKIEDLINRVEALEPNTIKANRLAAEVRRAMDILIVDGPNTRRAWDILHLAYWKYRS